MSVLVTTLVFAAILAAYLAILAVTVVILDETLAKPKKLAQAAIAVLLPILGPITILFMAHAVSPAMLRWVPWPFKAMVADRAIKRYSSLEEQSSQSDATGL